MTVNNKPDYKIYSKFMDVLNDSDLKHLDVVNIVVGILSSVLYDDCPHVRMSVYKAIEKQIRQMKAKDGN